MARGNVFNFNEAFIWRVNDNGIAVGQLDPDNLGTSPQTSHAFRLRGPISLEMPAVEFAISQFVGGGRYEGRAVHGVQNINDGRMSASQIDTALYPLIDGAKQDTTTVSGWEISGPNYLNPNGNRLGGMFVAKYQDRASAISKNKYLHVVMPAIEMRAKTPNLTQEPGTNPAAVEIDIIAAIGSKFPTGVAFGSAQGWYNFENLIFMIFTDYPLALTAFQADGVATTFTLAFKPQYNDVTGGNTKNWTTKNGANTAASSINTSSKVVTVAAGSNNDLWVAMCPTQNYAE